MTQEEHDEYTRELEDKVEHYKSMLDTIKHGTNNKQRSINNE